MKTIIIFLLLLNISNAKTFDFTKQKKLINKNSKNYLMSKKNIEFCSLDKNYKSKCINQKNKKEEIKND